MMSEIDLYKWDIWFVGVRRYGSWAMRAHQMARNILDYYPGFNIFHTICDCATKSPHRVILIFIKKKCPCWWRLDNVFILDVIDKHGGDINVRRFPLDRGVVFAQSSRQKHLYESKGIETFLVA